MAGERDEFLTVLKSIDASLKTLVGLARARQPKPPPQIAPDADLDGQHGDPVVKYLPRDWDKAKQGDYTNRRMSEMPPDLLDMLAKMYDDFAAKDEAEGRKTSGGKATAPLKRKDAARARGWAKRKREGWVPPASSMSSDTTTAPSGWAGGTDPWAEPEQVDPPGEDDLKWG